MEGLCLLVFFKIFLWKRKEFFSIIQYKIAYLWAPPLLKHIFLDFFDFFFLGLIAIFFFFVRLYLHDGLNPILNLQDSFPPLIFASLTPLDITIPIGISPYDGNITLLWYIINKIFVDHWFDRFKFE